MLAQHFVEQRRLQQLPVEQTGVERRQAAGIAMSVGRRLGHAFPARLVTASQHHGWVGEGQCAHGGRLVEHVRQYSPKGLIVDLVFGACHVGAAGDGRVVQAEVEVQPERHRDPLMDALRRRQAIHPA
ncbi:hypothetical protein D3C78_1335640 [compost metagenome]